MSFVRPEARAALWRWREAITGACALGFGLWWALTGAALTRWIGVVVALAALALLLAGVQRGRFRGQSDGMGVVRTDEGQVAYFGPLSGGIVAFTEITELAYDPSGKPAYWILSQRGQEDLYIPVDASGAEALFDVFTRLPGLKTEKVLRVMAHPPASKTVLWTRSSAPAIGHH